MAEPEKGRLLFCFQAGDEIGPRLDSNEEETDLYRLKKKKYREIQVGGTCSRLG